MVIINNYTHRIFMKKNMITPYMPPTAGKFSARVHRQTEGYWFGLYLVPYAIDLQHDAGGQRDAAPKSYDDLLNPEWKGQISLEREEYLVTQSHMQYMGQAKSIGLFQATRAARSDSG